MNSKTLIPSSIKTGLAMLRSRWLVHSVLRRTRRLDERFSCPSPKSRRRIHFLPDVPDHLLSMWKLCHVLNVQLSSDNGDASHDLQFFWSYRTVAPDVPIPAGAINSKCSDIGKESVDRVFKEVFGYGASINPVSYKGVCVKKSAENAAHDGRLVACPADPEPGFVYQLVVNNVEAGMAEDLRTPVFRGVIPFVYEKRRPISDRFSNVNTECLIRDPHEVFSQDEQRNIIRFCERFNVEYGELDILRDKQTNRLFIIDVNPTPSGPPNHLRKSDVVDAIILLTAAFEEAFLESAAFSKAAQTIRLSRGWHSPGVQSPIFRRR